MKDKKRKNRRMRNQIARNMERNEMESRQYYDQKRALKQLKHEQHQLETQLTDDDNIPPLSKTFP